MTEARPGGWRFGPHPAAVGAVIRSIDRRDIRVGDALRVEMQLQDATETVLLQYFIVTRSGGWAMWATCAADEVGRYDATVAAIIPAEDAPDDG